MSEVIWFNLSSITDLLKCVRLLDMPKFSSSSSSPVGVSSWNVCGFLVGGVSGEKEPIDSLSNWFDCACGLVNKSESNCGEYDFALAKALDCKEGDFNEGEFNEGDCG